MNAVLAPVREYRPAGVRPGARSSLANPILLEFRGKLASLARHGRDTPENRWETAFEFAEGIFDVTWQAEYEDDGLGRYIPLAQNVLQRYVDVIGQITGALEGLVTDTIAMPEPPAQEGGTDE